MAKTRTNQLTGVAGVHYVAASLTYLGFHAVPTTRNIAGPDLLVSTLDGSRGDFYSSQDDGLGYAHTRTGREEASTSL